MQKKKKTVPNNTERESFGESCSEVDLSKYMNKFGIVLKCKESPKY